MPKANDFVRTLAPMKNFMVSDNQKEFCNSTSWLEKKAFWIALSLARIDHPFGQLVKVRAVLSANKGDSGLLLLETLILFF